MSYVAMTLVCPALMAGAIGEPAEPGPAMVCKSSGRPFDSTFVVKLGGNNVAITSGTSSGQLATGKAGIHIATGVPLIVTEAFGISTTLPPCAHITTAMAVNTGADIFISLSLT